MSSPDDKVRGLISEEAAEWFLANREGLTAKERQVFVAWLRMSPMHVEEYLAYSVIARDLHEACAYRQDALTELLARARTDPEPVAPSSWPYRAADLRQTRASRWQRTAVVTALCAAAASIGWVALRGAWPMKPKVAPEAVGQTPGIQEIHLSARHGEQRSHRLADNSVVHLNTDSDVTIRYSNQERLVILHAGEAEFDVVHATSRPFRVIAGAAQVTDLGTKFDVMLEREKTVITVVEGKIAVSPTMSAARGSISVGGDRQITVVDGDWPPAQPIPMDAEHATAWLHRQIVFDHEPLDKVAAEFNRYAQKPIEIVTPGLQKLEISGVFTTDDPTAFIAFLRSLGNVRVDETATQIRVSGQPK